jgi:hypothetical protein
MATDIAHNQALHPTANPLRGLAADERNVGQRTQAPMRRRLPRLRADKNACESPHVVILGAGASRAACPTGDANGRLLPVMADLVELAGLEPLLKDAGISYRQGQNFEAIYESLAADPSKAAVQKGIEARLRDYFAAIVIPDRVTVYDKLLLSLRAKDYIATFNWDPLLAQALKRSRHLGELPRVLFLHGNVDAGACIKHRQKGFREHSCPHCGRSLTPVPLLYPIGTKEYESHPFIQNEWTELRAAIEDAYILTIFGYAAPVSDVAAKGIMLDAWKANETLELAEIDIIDIKPEAEVEATWRPFFVRTHYGVSTTPTWLFQHARRSCDHFAMATLQQRPCQDNPLPTTDDLAVLHHWVNPLIAQEVALRNEGAPFPC